MTEMSKCLLPDQYTDSKNLSARVSLHARFSTNPLGWMNWLFEQLDLREVTHILEIGCGPGGLWRDQVKSIPANCRLVLSDVSPGMVSEARQALLNKRITFEVIDAQAIPYPDDTFDCVIASHMLYHVPDLRRTLSEVTRVLKPGGKLYAATNGRAHMRELHNIIRRPVHDFHIMTTSFTLENGEELLQHYFGDVTIRRYEDKLIVPDASALSAYVRSMASLSDATEEQLREIDRTICEEIDRQGQITISKDTGVFIASHPRKTEHL